MNARVLRWCCGILLLTGALGGCTRFTIDRDYDPQANFSALSTWAWHTASARTPRDHRNTLQNERIHDAIRQTLIRKGHQPAPPAQATYRVAYRYQVIPPRHDGSPRVGVGVGAGSGGGYGGVSLNFGSRADRHPRLVLAVEMRAPETDRLLWHGRVETLLPRGDSPEATRERIRDAVGALLKPFPPSPR